MLTHQYCLFIRQDTVAYSSQQPAYVSIQATTSPLHLQRHHHHHLSIFYCNKASARPFSVGMTSNHQTKWTVATIAAVLVLANLAVCIHRSSRLYLFQQSLCLQHYLSTDVNKIGPFWHVDEALCKVQQVQSPLSIIEGLDAFLQLLPGSLPL